MKGKTILITGATSGIGEGCARKFAAMGSRLILNGRNTEKLESNRNLKRQEQKSQLFHSMLETVKKCVMPYTLCKENGRI